mgnify:CR=1 FL=1
MVKRLKLNEKTLREAEPKPGASYQIFDTEVIGFAARVQASGARTFTIDYRHAGRQRRMTIGRWPEWSVTAARERAKEAGKPASQRKSPGKLVEGSVIQGWKAALGELSLIYPDRINNHL